MNSLANPIRATRVSKWRLDVETRYPPMLVMIETSVLAIPTRLRPALTLRALMESLRDETDRIRLRIQSEPRV